MDLNMVLWIGGMLFSLSIFVVKVGFGLGLGSVRWPGIVLTLLLYLGIFILTAIFSASLIKILEPVVRKGPYLHALMAMGLIAWGILVLRHLAGQGAEFGLQPHNRNYKAKDSVWVTYRSALFLLIPCPVCLTAIIFATWAALNVIKLPALLVGLGLGIVFTILTLLVYFLIRHVTLNSTLISKRIGLGLSMVGIGLYFLTSLFLPARIEAAKTIYQSFATEGGNIALSDHLGVFLLLVVAILIGFLANKRREVSE